MPFIRIPLRQPGFSLTLIGVSDHLFRTIAHLCCRWMLWIVTGELHWICFPTLWAQSHRRFTSYFANSLFFSHSFGDVPTGPKVQTIQWVWGQQKSGVIVVAIWPYILESCKVILAKQIVKALAITIYINQITILLEDLLDLFWGRSETEYPNHMVKTWPLSKVVGDFQRSGR